MSTQHQRNVIVGGMVVAMYLPIFDMVNAVQ